MIDQDGDSREMTMRERILALLQARPFQSFRVELSSGAIHTVRHPDQAMLVGSLIIIGVPRGDLPGPDYADVAMITLLHVTKIEVLAAATT